MAGIKRSEVQNFIRMVKMMRQAQTIYFSNKGDRALKDAKAMERRVDEEAERLQKALSELPIPTGDKPDYSEPEKTDDKQSSGPQHD